MTADFDQLVIHYGIAIDEAQVMERQMGIALHEAHYQTRPRVTLVDEGRRIVRVLNVPEKARRNPPQLLSHVYPDVFTGRTQAEPVGRYYEHATSRDVDYRLTATRAGDDLLAHLRNELEPSIVVRRWHGGHADLLTIWES